MAEQAGQELDFNPLVNTILEKTKAGKLNWQPTARDDTFIVSVGGETTLQLTMETFETSDMYGQPETGRAPQLCLLDSKGRKLWEISSNQVGGLWSLYRLAQRIANKIDDRVAGLMEVLQKL
jgi:hypothetical protein